ncbi:DMT family protein [Oceanidesulfovibrio indonesiensis]|nr:DMT family protein [Oceanidesulfovibrio indonesiensis]
MNAAIIKTVVLLIASNVFMTLAWYGHLKHAHTRAWYVAAIASWTIAFFEYMMQVPANRIGYTVFSLPQLKIMQEVITLSVFVPFSIWYMGQPLKMDHLYAGLCLLGAVYFTFRG